MAARWGKRGEPHRWRPRRTRAIGGQIRPLLIIQSIPPTWMSRLLPAVRFLGSSGLNCLLDGRELVAQASRVQLHIAGLISPAVARPMEVTGLVDRFDTYPTVTDALTALAQ